MTIHGWRHDMTCHGRGHDMAGDMTWPSMERGRRPCHVPVHVMSPSMSCPRPCHVPDHVMSPAMSCARPCHVPGHVMCPAMSCPGSCHVPGHVPSHLFMPMSHADYLPCHYTCNIGYHLSLGIISLDGFLKGPCHHLNFKGSPLY